MYEGLLSSNGKIALHYTDSGCAACWIAHHTKFRNESALLISSLDRQTASVRFVDQRNAYQIRSMFKRRRPRKQRPNKNSRWWNIVCSRIEHSHTFLCAKHTNADGSQAIAGVLKPVCLALRCVWTHKCLCIFQSRSPFEAGWSTTANRILLGTD